MAEPKTRRSGVNIPDAQRSTIKLQLRVPSTAVEQLDALRGEQNRSEYVAALLDSESKRARKRNVCACGLAKSTEVEREEESARRGPQTDKIMTMKKLGSTDLLGPAAETITAIVALLGTFLWSAYFQGHLTVNGGLGWDGAQYARMAGDCWHGRMMAEPPFVFRPGGPCVAALISSSPLRGMFIGNLIASVLATGLLGLLLRRHIADWRIRTALLIAYIVCWEGPVRFTWYAPADSVDPWLHVFFIGGLIALESNRRAALLIPITFLGVLFREVMILFPFALVFVEWPKLRRPSVAALPVLFAGVLALAIDRALGRPTYHWSFGGTALKWAYTKGPGQYLQALLVAFGPVLALFVAFAKIPLEWLRGRRDVAFLLVGVGSLAWIGGSDTERFLYWCSPIVLVAAGRVLESVDLRAIRVPLLCLVAAQLLSERVGLATPDSIQNAPRAWPLLTAVFAQSSWSLSSQNPDLPMGALSIAEVLAVVIALGIWIRRSATRRPEAMRRSSEPQMG